MFAPPAMYLLMKALFLLVCAAAYTVKAALSVAGHASSTSSSSVPQATLQAFGSYPNLLNITNEMRENFHPVVKLPKRRKWKIWLQNRRRSNADDSKNACDEESDRGLMKKYDYIIEDHTGNKNNNNVVILKGGERVPQLLPTREDALEFAKTQKQSKLFDVGRFDEDRRGMYTSSLFDVMRV